MSRIDYKWIVAIVFVSGVFMDLLDTSSRQRGAAGAERPVRRERQPDRVGGPRLPAGAGGVDPGIGLGRRPLRHQADLPVRARRCSPARRCSAARPAPSPSSPRFGSSRASAAGMLIPVGTAMLFRAFPPIERAKASTVLMMPTVLAPALGPLVGGWFVTYHSWRWIFYLNVPVGVFAFALGVVGLQRAQGARRRSVRHRRVRPLRWSAWPRSCSRCRGGRPTGGPRRAFVIPGVCGLLAFAALVWVETHIDEPMLALRLLQERMFRRANIVTMLAFSSFVGLLFLMPLFLQELLGMTAIRVGAGGVPPGDRHGHHQPALRAGSTPRSGRAGCWCAVSCRCRSSASP